MEKITERESLHQHLEAKSTQEILEGINLEDQKVALAVKEILPEIKELVDAIHPRMEAGGRLFYIGAGTSGRLGIVDASECPPTFGVAHGLVVGLMAGGDTAIRKAVEFAEDDGTQGWQDLLVHEIGENDSVIGIAASGTTPYVVGALKECQEHNLLTGCITCNPKSPITEVADHALIPLVGPEYITGSTRMKSGTAQKLVLNMLSTSLMIKLGRVKGNRMVDMQLSNNKLVDRGTKMVMDALNISYEEANKKLMEAGSVREAIESGSL
ncbi:MAG: N-acetylmuramic acid 6-phosphate etherase [Bacteroidota bacterium]